MEYLEFLELFFITRETNIKLTLHAFILHF